jgi:hypothetical protein
VIVPSQSGLSVPRSHDLKFLPMVRIAISVEAFEAIARTLPLGSVGYENKVKERGERLIWLEPSVVDRLRAMRGPGESYSDVIFRLVELTPSGWRASTCAVFDVPEAGVP